MDFLDQLHADCIAERNLIRRQVRLLRFHVSTWRPRPMPTGWCR